MSYCFSKMSRWGAQTLLFTLVLGACGIQKKKGNDRTFVPNLDHSDPTDPTELASDPIMRGLPDDSLKGYGACKWLNKIGGLSGSGRFRIAQDIDVASKNFWEIWKKPIQYTDLFNRQNNEVEYEPLIAKTDIAANPLYQFALAYFTDKNIPNSAEFFKLFDQRMFSNPVTFPGFLAIRALLAVGLIDSIDQRNNEIKKEMLRTFPGVFASAKSGSLKTSFLKPMIKNGTSNLSKLSPWRDTSVPVEQRAEKFWRVMGRYGQSIPLFTSSSWRTFNDEIRISLSVAINSWPSGDPEEQACANILFQRTQAQLLTIMGHDRPGFTLDETKKSSSLFELSQLLTARDATTLRVCPTPGSFVKKGRRAYIALDDFAVEPGKRSAPIQVARGPFVDGPCLRPVSRQSNEYNNFAGPAISKSMIASGTELIDFVASASQYAIAFNPGAPWWPGKVFPLINLDGLDSLEKSKGIMPSVSYALSLGLMMIGLERVLDDHLVMVDFSNRRTTNEDAAMGVRISTKADPDKSLVEIQSDAQSALRMTELSFKFSETLDNLTLWYHRQMSDTEGDVNARAKLKDTITGLFGSEKNLITLTNSGDGSIRARLKKLQLATTLLITKYAKKRSDGSYTCYTTLNSNLETGKEVAAGDCATTDSKAHHLFKETAAILSKKYSSPLFREYAREKCTGENSCGKPQPTLIF